MEAHIQALIARIAKGDNQITDFSDVIQEKIQVELEKLKTEYDESTIEDSELVVE